MIYLLSLSILLLGGLGALAIWRLQAESRHWQRKYEERDREAHLREKQLFDQLLLKNGNRPAEASLLPSVPAKPARPQMDDEELDIAIDKIKEFMEAEQISASQALGFDQDVRSGKLTSGELDRALWKARRIKQDGEGSVLDI